MPYDRQELQSKILSMLRLAAKKLAYEQNLSETARNEFEYQLSDFYEAQDFASAMSILTGVLNSGALVGESKELAKALKIVLADLDMSLDGIVSSYNENNRLGFDKDYLRLKLGNIFASSCGRYPDGGKFAGDAPIKTADLPSPKPTPLSSPVLEDLTASQTAIRELVLRISAMGVPTDIIKDLDSQNQSTKSVQFVRQHCRVGYDELVRAIERGFSRLRNRINTAGPDDMYNAMAAYLWEVSNPKDSSGQTANESSAVSLQDQKASESTQESDHIRESLKKATEWITNT